MNAAKGSTREWVGEWFIDYRVRTELVVAVVLLAGFLAATGVSGFEDRLSKGVRSALYTSLTGSSASLLGFVLTGLAILVALPSTERMQALREHPKWDRVPSAFFRAARSLLATLAVTTLGIGLDSNKDPWVLWEAATVLALAISLVRVIAAVVVLDQIIAVSRAPKPKSRIRDEGL